MAADTEVCTMNEEQGVELGGKPGNTFKERMEVTLLEWQEIFFLLLLLYVTIAFAAVCRSCIQHEELWNRKQATH